MPELSLDESELELLRRILNQYYTDLRVEIQATDTPEYKDRLHEEEAMLQRLMERLPTVST